MGKTFSTGLLTNGIWQDASNNIGIGGSPSGSYKFEVTGTGRFSGALTGASATFSGLLVSNTSDAYPEFRTTAADADVLLGFSNTGDGNNGWGIGRRNTGEFWIAKYTGDFLSGTRTVPFMISTSGNVGIGTSSFSGWPAGNLVLKTQQASGISVIQAVSGDSGSAICLYSGASSSDHPSIISLRDMRFGTATDLGTGGYNERMRITSGGVLYVGASSIANSGTIMNVISTNNTDALSRFYLNAASSQSRPAIRVDKYDNTSTTAQVFIDFTINQQTAGNGSITANGASQATFTTWSDARLKENITDLPSQLSNIMALRPVEFDYKDGTGHQIGFIAQEVQEVYPDIVNENAEGYLTISGLSKTESRLIKALQEAVNKIEQLSAKVSALENK